ncbi:phage terminase small subunit P27 family [Salibacterium lacus]|uniref:Phage terminase small subunit P27 family n=1 Tax=Salibacterium lacus TaxID=1898109 RepID=A0ABW5SXP0_9BACI
MTQRGRPPKPSNLKVLEGNPGKRPLPEDEPNPKPVSPKPPTWLNTDAKKMWKRLEPELESMGLLTVVDGEAFAAACQSYGVWLECEKFFKKKNPETGQRYGRTYEYTNKAGATNITERPEVKIGQKALADFRAFCSEFGLTPASRTRLSTKSGDSEEDPMEQLLGG